MKEETTESKPSLRCETPSALTLLKQPSLAAEPVLKGIAAPGPETSSLPLPSSAEEWGTILARASRAAKGTILAKARLFWTAKRHLAHGEWSRIWKLTNRSQRPPESKRKADRYALIGKEFGDANETWPSHLVRQLPACVDALHYLAQLGRHLVMELLLSGIIHEGLSATKARELRNELRPELNKPRPFKFENWAFRIDNLVELLESEGTPQDRQAAVK